MKKITIILMCIFACSFSAAANAPWKIYADGTFSFNYPADMEVEVEADDEAHVVSIYSFNENTEEELSILCLMKMCDEDLAIISLIKDEYVNTFMSAIIDEYLDSFEEDGTSLKFGESQDVTIMGLNGFMKSFSIYEDGTYGEGFFFMVFHESCLYMTMAITTEPYGLTYLEQIIHTVSIQ